MRLSYPYPLPVVITTGPGLSDFTLHLQPRPSTSAEDVPALRAWNQLEAYSGLVGSLVCRFPQTASISDWHRRSSNSHRVRVPFH